MLGNSCIVETPVIQQLTNDIIKAYPEESGREGMSTAKCAEWVGAYQTAFNKAPDFVPDMKTLINFIESSRNKDGKSFLYIPESVTYRLPGQSTQTYTVIGSHIYNKNGEEVYSADVPSMKTHRLRIFANLAVQRGRAVVVKYRDADYIVNDKNQIMSVASSKIMMWAENDGNRKAILAEANKKLTFNNFKKAVEGLAGYFEGGGADIAVDLGLPEHIIQELDDHFMGGKELSMDFYREMWKYVDMVPNTGAYKKEFPYVLQKKQITEQQPLSQTPQTPKIDPVVQQLIDHIKSMGISVHLREELIKYVEQNKLDRVWEAVEQHNEMQSIRKQAVKDGRIILKEDGTFDYALAPNGKRSNLNERQWLQVRTENFKKWFGDWINDPANASKVVDDNGEPLVVYRGDSAGKRLFEPKKPSYNVRGIYIAGNKTFASNFTKPSFYNNFTEGTLYAVFVNAKNPIYDSRDVNGWNNGKYDNNDAWIYGAFPNGNGELVVRNSNQIKSATDNNGEFSTENNDIQMMVVGEAQNLPTTEEQIAWIEENKETLVKEYIEKNGNVFDPDEVRKMLEPLGYNGENLSQFYVSGNHLREYVLKEMLDRFSKSDNKTVTILTGTPGSGKSFATREMKESFSQRGLVLDAPFHTIQHLQDAINQAKEAGAKDEDIQVVAVYNGAETTYKNTIKRGKKERRWIPLEYFIQSFTRNRGKIKALKDNNPNVEIVTINNAENKGIECSIDDAYYWDYTINNEQINKLIDLIENDNEITEERKEILLGERFKTPKNNRENQQSSGREQESNRGGVGSQVRSINSGNAEQRVGLDSTIQFYKSQGREIYGFLTKEGHIYLDETAINPEHPIHEYTHLWDRYLMKYQSELWKQGVSLMQAIPLWNQIAKDDNYGKKWLAQGIKGEALINRVASEVHSRLTGQHGKVILDNIAKEKGKQGIVSKLKQWLLDFWKDLKATFSNWSQEEINKLTLDDFVNMTLRDFADALDFSKIGQQQAQQSGQQQSVIVELHKGYWTRDEVAKQKDKVFLFGDNTNDRLNTHHVPISTQAVIRGLPNAIGIDTKKNRGTSANSYFTDSDFGQFKIQVDNAIAQAKASGKTIVIPADGIGTGKAMLKEKAPKCFNYLQNELQKLQNPQQQSSLPGPETIMDIWWGTGESDPNRQNPYLSNFAERPFTIDSTDTALVKESGIQYKSVEQAFQHHKLLHVYDELSEEKFNELSNQILNATSAAQVKALGRRVPMSAASIRTWDEKSSEVMEQLIRASFQQNPIALQRLLDTGNTILTHTQDRGKWGKEFPRILMEVREELREEIQKKKREVEREIGKDEVKKTIDTLNSDNKELSASEKKSISEILGDKKPRVLIASETSDPVFHAKKIKQLVEEELAKKPKDRRFHMMYLITKHDGLPLKELAQLKIPKFIHFSITSLGGTKYEPGVMKMNDMLDRIETFIKDGVLDPNLVTIRIDPIIPGVTKNEDIRHIFERATKMGIRQFKFSVMDSYGYTESGERSTNSRDRYIIQKMSELGYDWDTYYGRDRNGKVLFDAKPQYVESIFRYIDALAEEFNVMINTCGEKPVNIPNLKRIKTQMGCVNVQAMNAAMGTNDIAHVQGHQRTHCSCYGLTSDALRYNDKCASSCVYCYAKHNSNAAMKYYNEDGTLKDTPFTRTSEDQPVVQQNQTADITTSKETPTQQPPFNTSESASIAAGRRKLNFGNTGQTPSSQATQSLSQGQQPVEPKPTPKPERPKSEVLKSALNIKEDRTTVFRRTFSAQQIKDRGAYISDLFSAAIDSRLRAMLVKQQEIIDGENTTEEDKINAAKTLASLRDPVRGRQKVVQEEGVESMIDECIKQIDFRIDAAQRILNRTTNNAVKEEKEKLIQLLKNTKDFFVDLFNAQGSIDIEEREGIRIVDLKVKDKTAQEEEDEEGDDGNDETGNNVSGNEGWVFKIRYTDPFNSLSKKVRSMLYEVKRPDSEKDDIGRTRNYPQGQIYASFLSYLSKNMQNPDDFLVIEKDFNKLDTRTIESLGIESQEEMDEDYPNGVPIFPILEKMTTIYPWARQIIDRLTADYESPEINKSLRYPPTGGGMASQFYTNFRKAFIPYGKIQVGDGYFGVTPLNYDMAERMQYDKLVANYNNRIILTDRSLYNSDGTVNKENAEYFAKKAAFSYEEIEKDVKEAQRYLELLEKKDDPNQRDWWEYWKEELEEEMAILEPKYNKFIEKALLVLHSAGIEATAEGVVVYLKTDTSRGFNTLLSMIDGVVGAAKTIMKIEDDKVKDFDYILDMKAFNGGSMWKYFFDGAGLITDISYMQSFYDSASKKTKYSYSADNFLMKTMRGVMMGSQEQRQKYIDEHYGKYEWFKNQKTGEWRNHWLDFWYNYPGSVDEIPYKNIDNITEMSETTKVRPYVKWNENDIWLVQNRSYGDPEKKQAFGYFLAPIFSDSPMSMTVKGPRMTIEQLLYGENGKSGALVDLVFQELWRIKYGQQRREAIAERRVNAIANFDGKDGKKGNAEKFMFIPELNTFRFEDGTLFLDMMIQMKRGGATKAQVEQAIIHALEQIMARRKYQYEQENRYQYLDDAGMPVEMNGEQFLNMVYASAMIIQLTTSDLAFYKNYDDFQKRFKEVYAGGIQLNTNSKYGMKNENVILLTDDIITSPSYSHIASIIDASKNLSAKDKDDIKDIFKDINVADAQAVRSMYFFRAILDMMGNWTDEMEQALNHFKEGTWKREDFDIIYQIIKPFMYSMIAKSDGIGGEMLVPVHHKNSEICALMMYSLISNDLKNSPVYQALSEFMDTTTDAKGNPLIHMIQYESANKVGGQGAINISFVPRRVVWAIEDGITVKDKDGNNVVIPLFPAFVDKETKKTLDNTDANAKENYKAIKEQLDEMLDKKEITQEQYNEAIQSLRPDKKEIISILKKAALVRDDEGNYAVNPEVVQTIPMDNYYQQQPTPVHHIDAEAVFGSQARNLGVADLPEDFVLTVEGKNGSHTFKGRDAVIDFYYELLNENLIEDFFGTGKKNSKGLKGLFSSKEELKKAIEDIVRGNPKYGHDFYEAFQLDENGDFVLSPNSPTIFRLTQEIITSFFKNRITKQKIDGAALIQAAGIGLDENLRVVFDKNGKVVGAECYMPLTSQKFFEPLLKTKMVNGKEVRVLDPKILEKAGLNKALGYRIPTENKSSMMPLIIKGFTPLQNGSAIVLPAEITAMAGSDFDVDKMFLMLLSFYIQNYDKKRAREDYRRTSEAFDRSINLMMASGFITQEDLEDEDLENFMDDDYGFNEWFEENKEKYSLDKPRIHAIKYDFKKTPKQNGRKARNNMLIQMLYNILVSKEGSESLFNPQGFKDVVNAAKLRRIATDPLLKNAFVESISNENAEMMPSADVIRSMVLDKIRETRPQEEQKAVQMLSQMSDEDVITTYSYFLANSNVLEEAVSKLLKSSTKDLKDFISKHAEPESPIYPTTYAHLHSRNMAGANQLGIYAIQSSMSAKYQRADITLLPIQQYTINGRTIKHIDISDGGKRVKGEGQMVGASADNGKDPNLTDMGSTSKTAPIIGYMIRSGLSHREAALIVSQPMMIETNYNSKHKEWKNAFGGSPLNTPVTNVTTEMLLKNVMFPELISSDEAMQIDAMCYRILQQYEAMEYFNKVSRADSPNGSMQNTYAKVRIQQYQVDLLQAHMGQTDFPFYRVREALSNDAIDVTSSEESVREQLKHQRMAFLHGMYALGINSFNSLVAPYFFGADKIFDEIVTKPVLYNLEEGLMDSTKEDIVDGIYKSFITYRLSESPLFGEEMNEKGNIISTFKEKRDYYLKSFPDEFIKILQENEDIRDLLKNILEVIPYNGRNRIVCQNVGSLGKAQLNEAKRRLEQLLYLDNQKAQELAKDLLIYSFFDNGLQFTPQSFSTLFTTRYLASFPAYTETLNTLNEPLTEEQYDNFIQQFYITYPEAAFKVDGIINAELDVDDLTGVISLDFNDKDRGYKLLKSLSNALLSPDPRKDGINPYPYISYNGDIYVLNEDLFEIDSSRAVYNKLPKYASNKWQPLFNMQMSVDEMSEQFSDIESQQPQPVITPEQQDAMPYVQDAPDVLPSREEQMAQSAEEFDNLGDWDPTGGMDIDFAMDLSNEEKYQKGGENELESPFC